MKEFLKTNTVTYNLMSFTGFKSLLIFSLLLDGAKSYNELQEILENHPYLHETVSFDTLRPCTAMRNRKASEGRHPLRQLPVGTQRNDSHHREHHRSHTFPTCVQVRLSPILHAYIHSHSFQKQRLQLRISVRNGFSMGRLRSGS